MLLQKNILLFLLFFLNVSLAFAQTPYVWQNKDFDEIKNFEILPDKGYTFEQILTDTSLVFIKNPKKVDFQKTKESNYYWIRCSIKNNSAYSKSMYLNVFPIIENTLYIFDFENNTWKQTTAGLKIANHQRQPDVFLSVFRPANIDTFFVKVNVEQLSEQPYPVPITIYLEKEHVFDKKEEFMRILWISTCVALVLFFLYNTYLFFIFKDKVYLYYLIILIGSLVYITSVSNHTNIFLPFKWLNVEVVPNGSIFFFDSNAVVIRMGIILLLIGLVKFTCLYLMLSNYLPLWNRILTYLLWISVCYSLLSMWLILGANYYNIYFLLLENLFVGSVILAILCVGVLSLIKGYKPAKYFLIANSFPLLVVLLLTVYFFLYEMVGGIGKNIYLIPSLAPNIAILSQTLAFAVALVARVNLIKDELKEKQLEAKTLQNQNEEILARNRYIELENEYIMADMVAAVNKEADLQQQMKLEINQKTELEQQLKQKIDLEINQKAELQAKLEANQRELTANTLYLYQKNEMLNNLQKQIENLSYKDTTAQNREGIKEIKSAIKNEIQLDTDWDKFKIHFEQVHPNFFKELNEKYPSLTPNEIRLAAYYHLNMSAKEIATLLNINPTSVHRAKSRLNKKMEALDKGE